MGTVIPLRKIRSVRGAEIDQDIRRLTLLEYRARRAGDHDAATKFRAELDALERRRTVCL